MTRQRDFCVSVWYGVPLHSARSFSLSLSLSFSLCFTLININILTLTSLPTAALLSASQWIQRFFRSSGYSSIEGIYF
ncbi:hypothetical protein GBA52_021399 [Prunus armeniaca]|nr:hypothetical protein GBA52_021399 [Prunus armeniaca]